MSSTPSTYTTRQGDTWDQIALRVLGNERWMYLFLDANPAVNYTLIFDAGVVLNVPALPTPALPSSLPPWKVPA